MEVFTLGPQTTKTAADVAGRAGEAFSASTQRLIEFSVIGAAFVLMFMGSAFLIWQVLKAARAEIEAARKEADKANDRGNSIGMKSVQAVTQVAERVSRMIDMQEGAINLLTVLVGRGGGRNVPTDAPEDV